MQVKQSRIWLCVQVMVCALLTVAVPLCQAQTSPPVPIWQDEFDSSIYTLNNWKIVNRDTSIGGVADAGTGDERITDRAQFNGVPVFPTGAGFVTLQLNTYNDYYDTQSRSYPYAGQYFKGTEMFTRVGFGPGTDALGSGVTRVEASSTGFDIEARVRFNHPHAGLVAAAWTYWNHGPDSRSNNSLYSASEIDHELLGNYSSSPSKIHVASFRRWYAGYGYTDGVNDRYHSPLPDPTVSGLDWTQWCCLKIRWTPITSTTWQVDWFAKQNETDSYPAFPFWSTTQANPPSDKAAPDQWMTVRLNIWAPGPKWGKPTVAASHQ